MREQSSAPSVAYTVALLAGACLLAIAAAGPRSYLDRVQSFPDMASYAEAARAVRHWQLSGIAAKQFWGYAYAGALVSFVLPGVPMLVVLVILSAVTGCLATSLAHRLWGGWVAASLTALGWQWIQRVAFGGSEPLFLALTLATFLAARREHWRRAVLWAALASTVRPIGVFALAGVLAAAIVRRRWLDAAIGVGIAVAVMALYLVPLARTGDALGNMHWYMPQMTNGDPIGLPFVALWRATHGAQVSPLRQILLAGAIAVVLAACVAAFTREQSGHLTENIFAAGTSCFLVTLNCLPCAWAFPRFAIVSLPFALVVVRRWLPRDDRVVAVMSIVAALLAAAMQIDDRAPGTALLHLFAMQ
jgi:hypothetical protein